MIGRSGRRRCGFHYRGGCGNEGNRTQGCQRCLANRHRIVRVGAARARGSSTGAGTAATGSRRCRFGTPPHGGGLAECSQRTSIHDGQ